LGVAPFDLPASFRRFVSLSRSNSWEELNPEQAGGHGEVMVQPKMNQEIPSTSHGRSHKNEGLGSVLQKDLRNRASPARLVKLYKNMSDAQRKKISDAGFGGLLKIGTGTLPVDLINWLLSNFNPETSEIVVPGRGCIRVTAESVHRMFRLPKGGDKVPYDFDVNAINFIHETYGIDDCKAPSLKSIVTRLKQNKKANDDYLRTWILLAVSTFLCPSTSLSISPKCYPAVRDLTKVKNLDWCQFVVDCLINSMLTRGKKNSVRGCIFLLALLYLDSLDVQNVKIPSGLPRVKAWSKSLIRKIIKLDTNRYGSFGNLKLKGSAHAVTQNSFLGRIEDIESLVASKTGPGISNAKKRKLCEIVSNACAGITEVVGNFVGQVSELFEDNEHPERGHAAAERAQAASETEHVRRSARAKGKKDYAEEDDSECIEDDEEFQEDEEDDEDEYSENEDDGGEEDDEEEESTDNEDDLEDEEDGAAECNPQQGNDEVMGQPDISKDIPSTSQDTSHKHKQRFVTIQGEDDFEEENEVPLVRNSSMHKSVRPEAPVIVQPKEVVVLDSKNDRNEDNPQAIGAIPFQQGTKRVGSPILNTRERQCRWKRLRLAEPPVINLVSPECVVQQHQTSTSVGEHIEGAARGSNKSCDTLFKAANTIKQMEIPDVLQPVDQTSPLKSNSVDGITDVLQAENVNKPNSWDFEPPDCDLIKYLESTPPENIIPPDVRNPRTHGARICAPNLAAAQLDSLDQRPSQQYEDSLFDAMSEEELMALEQEARRKCERKVLMNKQGAFHEAAPPLETPSKTQTLQQTLGCLSINASSAPSTSITPAFQPAPRRPLKLPAVMRSPYVDYNTKPNFKCSTIINKVYDAVIASSPSTSRRTTRSSQNSEEEEDNIINYMVYHVSLKHLAESVRPRGELSTTVAELGIFALTDDTKNRIKRILPLRVATFLQSGQLRRNDVRICFSRTRNHLDRLQLIMFPVLQKWQVEGLDEKVSHYFLLCLNLREERFEVLDSMRTLADENLKRCCNVLVLAIKELWTQYYPNSKKKIDNYGLIDVQVPKQSTPYDCGFHMLMNTEHWDGRSVPNFSEEDMPNIRKLLTYKWLTHKHNISDWKEKLNVK
ncbi:hypothetical protein EJB05_55238, partial [Eragrostis curvula]